MKNLYLIQPNFRQPYFSGSDDKTVEGCFFLPYSVANLWAYAKQFDLITDNYELKQIIFKREPFSTIVGTLESPAIAAFSNYSWCWEYNIELARQIKENFPTCLIVFGGPMIPDDSSKFFTQYPHVDIAVHAEGEYTFRDILEESIAKLPNYKEIPGISLNIEKTTFKTEKRPRIANLDDLPNPYVAGVFDKLVRENPLIRWNATIETTRGCPYSCTFCDWGSMTYAKVKKYNNAAIKEALDWCARYKIEYIHVADANFGIFKEKDAQIVDHVIGLRTKTGYPEVFCATWPKNPTPNVITMIKKLTTNGLDRGLTLSVQSMSEKVLGAVKRRNMDMSNFKVMLDLCNKQNVPSYTELILGLPEETFDSWRSGICEIIEAGQHNSIDVWLHQLLTNAEMNSPENHAKYLLETVTTKKYLGGLETTEDVSETATLVKATNTMPFTDYINSYMFAWCVINFHTYGWTQIFSRFLRSYQNISYLTFYDALYDYISMSSKSYINAQFVKTREVITTFLEVGSVDGTKIHSAIGKNILGDVQQRLHQNREHVWKDLERFFEQWGEFEVGLKNDLLAFQKEFVTDPKKHYPYKRNYHFNVFDYITNSKSLQKDEYQFEFSLLEEFKDSQDYMGKLYFRRNIGWGKAKVNKARTTNAY